MENRPKVAEVIARPTYINCPPAIILERLMGKYDYGDGRVEQDPNYMIFSNRDCNYPHQIYGNWWLTQFRRWGMVKGAPDYDGIAKRVLRPDIYLEAMKELGVDAEGRRACRRSRCSTARSTARIRKVRAVVSRSTVVA